MSFLDKKPFIFLWRPVYRHLVMGVLWPFLERLKAYFLIESLVRMDHLRSQLDLLGRRLDGMSGQNNHMAADFSNRFDRLSSQNDAARASLASRLQALEHQNRALVDRFSSTEHHHAAIVDRLAALAEENRRQWETIEQLLLAFLSEPRPRLPEEQAPDNRFRAFRQSASAKQ